MKLHGNSIEGPKEQVIVIPRDNTQYVFKAKAVLDFAPFEAICPQPKPPEVVKPGGIRAVDLDNPKFKELMNDWATKKAHWMVIKSLEATEGLTWDTVKMDDPSTYVNYQKEMEESGLLPTEVSRITMKVHEACGLNQDRIDEATENFLAGQQAASDDDNYQRVDLSTTLSSEPAKDAE